MSKSHSSLSKELTELIQSIGDSRSKQEEDKIMKAESEILKSQISKTSSTPTQKKEFLIRSIYLEMLGHDASFAHLHAVNLTQDKNILNKRIGYLACALLLNDNSEFLILLVSSIQKDLQSQNWVEVCMALSTVARFANPLIIQAVSEPVIKLLDSKDSKIRKKAVMCLYKFYQIDKNSVPECENKMKRLLCDPEPAVMAATLPFYKEMALKCPENMKELVNPFIVILKQVIENKLPKEFNYHRFPGPWIQNSILEILSLLGKDDQRNSEMMYEVVGQCLRTADRIGINIGYATVYQCVKTICVIYPNSHLIELASNTISRFLSSDSPNLRCTGINGLTLIIQINPSYVMNYQNIIVDCMEVNDETLKKNTFELLYKMTNLKNVEIIVEKMMNYLKKTTLEIQSKKDILQKIIELTERFAPDKTWFIKIMNELFVNFGDMINDEILAKLISIISEWEKETEDVNEFKKYTVENYATIVENYSILSDSFVKLMAWVIGEYTNKLYLNDDEKIKGILEMLSYLLNKNYDDEMTKCFLINAIAKIHSNTNFAELGFINEIMEKYSRMKNPELQQRCLEYKRTKEKNISLYSYNKDIAIDFDLKFLSDYSNNKSNGKVYNPELSDFYTDKFSSTDVKLNIGPYQVSSNLFSMPGKSGNLNNLYETNDNYTMSDMKNELNVKAEKKWGEEGYKNETKNTHEKTSMINVQSIGSSNSNVQNNSIFNNGKSENYAGISSQNQNSGNYDHYANNSMNSKNFNKKKVEEYDPNSQQKKKLMNDLFGGLDGQETKTKKENKKKNNKESEKNLFNNLNINTNKNNTSNNNNNINLFEGLTQNNTNTNSNINNNQFNQTNNIQNNNNNQGNVDLLGDIFGSNTNSNTNMNNNNNNNLNNLFSNLSPPQQTNSNNNNYFMPLNINTEQFGEMWENSPDEDSFSININIQSPQNFHNIIKSKGNFAAVDIINNEAISAANYKNQFALVHATIEPNQVSLLVKCQNKSYNNEVGYFVMGLFK